jgi:hypothetical protein
MRGQRGEDYRPWGFRRRRLTTPFAQAELPLRVLKLTTIPFGTSSHLDPAPKPTMMRLLDTFRRTKLETPVFYDAGNFRGYSVNDFIFSLPSVRSVKLYAGYHTYPFRFASNVCSL